MNANELADELNKLDTKIMVKGLPPNDLVSGLLCEQAATLLRTIPALEAEIEGLKNEIKEFEAEKQKDFERKW